MNNLNKRPSTTSKQGTTMNIVVSFAKRRPLSTFFGLTFAIGRPLQGSGEDIPWFTFGHYWRR